MCRADFCWPESVSLCVGVSVGVGGRGIFLFINS